MVAFSSSRRKPPASSAPVNALAVLNSAGGPPMDSMFCSAASHRADRGVAITTSPAGEIQQVRIGRWRVLSSAEERRVAEVRELACQRVAVRIERRVGNGPEPSSEIWQLYDLDGHLDAAMQVTPDGRFAMLTNYRTRQACRLKADGEGALHAVESWKI